MKNKLDGGIYAIKRIKLNPKNKQLNKKITREVKLLSRMNHENVVRYYNSWIESAVITDTVEEQESRASSERKSSEPVTVIVIIIYIYLNFKFNHLNFILFPTFIF